VRYKVVIVRGAQKSLLAIPSPYFEQIEEKLRVLVDTPRPPGCKKLKGRDGWRVRSGNYRIIYEIDDPSATVTVVAIGPRGEIYR
jgi:mRNA interferase RelE/StbE